MNTIPTVLKLPALMLALVCLLVQAAPAPAQRAGDSTASPGTITFVGKNALFTANGSFHRWRFDSVEIDRAHPELSVVEVDVDIDSIDTAIGRRDDHLKSADFFDVERFPTAHVKLFEAIRKPESDADKPKYAVKLQVRIRDVEKTVDGEFEVVGTNPPTVEGTTTIDRVDFGIGEAPSRWNPMSISRDIPVRFRAVLPSSAGE